MEDIRIHGMGGQGVVALGELLAIAASYENKFCRAFPMYGSARRGAPVLAFTQIGNINEASRSMIYHPNYLLILDTSMPKTMNVTKGLKKDGIILYNTPKSSKEVTELFKTKISKIATIDATGIAQKVFGKSIPNTTMLGALVRVGNILNFKSVDFAIKTRFDEDIAKKNIDAAKLGYKLVDIMNFELV
jgi:pyruvate ferredoxin oxidoreductase gamma subunit